MTRKTGAAAETAPSAFNPDDFVVSERPFSQLRTAVVWLAGALVAVAGVVVAARSEQGMARINALMGKGQPTGVETTEAVRTLQAERDRLASRVDSLERMVGDITASIPRDMTARQPAGPVVSVREPPPLVYAPSTIEPRPAEERPAVREVVPPPAAPARPAPQAAAPVPQGPPQPQPRPVQTVPVLPQAPPAGPQPLAAAPPAAPAAAAPAESTALRTEFGVDLGGDTGLDGVRALWVSLRAGQAQALEGLRPMVAVRETARGVEFRLLAGPFENAGGAARLCARLALTGIYCQPTVFDGQRLALR